MLSQRKLLAFVLMHIAQAYSTVVTILMKRPLKNLLQIAYVPCEENTCSLLSQKYMMQFVSSNPYDPPFEKKYNMVTVSPSLYTGGGGTFPKHQLLVLLSQLNTNYWYF